LGTPQELTTPEGDIVWSAHYRAYGEIARLDVGNLDNPLRFQGQYFDKESGLHYNRHRYYNPDIGRYLTPDPVKLAGGINGYRYVPNPTGWVDPLGLSTCPGEECKPNAPPILANPTVNEGAPALPQLARTERKTRIDELTEKNAKRRVLGWEQEYNMHSVEKHGPDITDRALKQRSIDGTNPTTGEIGPVASSSQFKSWKMQLHAINKTMGRVQGNAPSPTGFDGRGNPVVVVELPGAGRGYKPNSRDVNNPRYIENMNRAEIRFDRNNTTKPFTAFPK
ncbi:RHS repeat-associated core domain-containing protein, partial [Pseudomonas sp.]|uniref:RHS repeat-associated core domain-containing protein n=4 Tax=unclassified Pseudomonas TaxID=196821 RepID=UPI0028AD3C99